VGSLRKEHLVTYNKIIMRKLYALLAGFILSLASNTNADAKNVSPDVANFTFTVVTPDNNVLFTNTSTIGSEPGIRRAYWHFGDGSIQMTGPLENTRHHYQVAGTYTVCLKIYRFRPNMADSVLSAQVCKTVVIQTACTAGFVTLNVAANPLLKYFVAQPSHNQNKKPVRVCWRFGDGRDTCINYPASYNGAYGVSHLYGQPGNYNVCVNILYDGGCRAEKCRQVEVVVPDRCKANFSKLAVATGANPLQAIFRALPWHNNNKRPVRICWTFGDGRDTCIQYSTTFPGPYLVNHIYAQGGIYEVCVKILYQGGCEARKCNSIRIESPDSCRADFERLPTTPHNNPRSVVLKALPWHNNNKKPARICWQFGDGRDTCINYTNSYTGQYTVNHTYRNTGLYEVCVKIEYFGGCEARKCKNIQVGERPDSCRADFERIPSPNADPRRAYFKALPWHNNNKKPQTICWRFGDGQDTCINYPANYSGQYVVTHNYQHRGLYEVCVKILYFGGCEARKCHNVQIGERDSCSADFERGPDPGTSPLTVGLKALPWNNNNRKPSRVCWNFGDGRDTCINYPESYTGLYHVVNTYPHPGQYEVCVKIFYYGGCEARKCKTIVVPPPPVNCTVRLFEITPSITSLVRGFLAVPHSDSARRPERVCWYFGDGEDTCVMINPQQPIPNLFIRHTYPAPGVYRACVQVRFRGGCIAVDCREVIIRPASNLCGGYMTDSLSGPRTFKFKGFSIHNPNDEVLSYRWTFGDGTSALGREVTHTFNHGGNYEVCLFIKTRLGCETRICKTVRVPGNNQPALQLTPNPVINVLNVAFLATHTEQVNIKILNTMGNQVRTYVRNVNVGLNNWNHDLSNLMPGMYSYIVQSPNQLASALFIKL
jgi:PKD repeat protein